MVSAQPRRGPPRGPIKGDRSQFFGKEGEQAQQQVPMPTILIAIACAVLLVGLKVYFKPKTN